MEVLTLRGIDGIPVRQLKNRQRGAEGIDGSSDVER